MFSGDEDRLSSAGGMAPTGETEVNHVMSVREGGNVSGSVIHPQPQERAGEELRSCTAWAPGLCPHGVDPLLPTVKQGIRGKVNFPKDGGLRHVKVQWALVTASEAQRALTQT